MSQFNVGQTYSMRSVCDHNCIWSYKVIKRTAKTVKLEPSDKTYGDVITCRPYIYEGIEKCKPTGSYSMAPILSADKVVGSVQA